MRELNGLGDAAGAAGVLTLERDYFFPCDMEKEDFGLKIFFVCFANARENR